MMPSGRSHKIRVPKRSPQGDSRIVDCEQDSYHRLTTRRIED